MNQILVSIVCNAFNQEKYIADAIDSFLIQSTDFDFEILIHDDCSTDDTANIIKTYQKKYPSLIKTIIQTENQYSKGFKVTRINSERARGKYIALCEGDDYWTDPLKLQKQIDYLEKNQEVTLCVHGASIIDAKTNKQLDILVPSNRSRYFTTDEIIFGGGGLFATNSMVFRREDFKTIPDFYDRSKVGDYPLTVYLSLLGKVYFMNEIMSAYRTSVPGSWTEEHFQSEFEVQNGHFMQIESLLESINDFSCQQLTPIVNQTILRNRFNLYLGHGRLYEMKKDELEAFYKELKSDSHISRYYNNLNNRQKIKTRMNQYTPRLFMYTVKIKRMFS